MRLRNYVLLPEHDTKAQDVVRYALRYLQLRNLRDACFKLGSWFCEMLPCCHQSATALLLITLYMLNVNQAAITLRGELELGLWKFED